MSRSVKIAVQGCCHGELNAVYAAIAAAEEIHGYKVDLLIVGGDFQCIRNLSDLSCMAVPAKFRRLGDFADYYAGKKVAPVLTLFVGGNHEASNYLQELFYGGWVAPNIYYLGAANVVSFAGLRIGGISGIWSRHDYVRGHHERVPYDRNTLRSVYHVRQYEVKKLLAMYEDEDRCDVFLSHDWPRGIEQHGNTAKLLRDKPFFKQEVARNDLGSPANEELMAGLKPRYWFSAHLHVKFEAMVHHNQHKRTKIQHNNDLITQQNPEEISLDLDEPDVESGLNPEEIVLELDDVEEPRAAPLATSTDLSSMDSKKHSQASDSIHAETTTQETTLEEYKRKVLERNNLSEDAKVPLNASRSRPSLEEPGSDQTYFLALDKCVPRRKFLEVLTIPVTETTTTLYTEPYKLRFDPKWLAITRTFAPYLSKSAYQKQLPSAAILESRVAADLEWVRRNVEDLDVPLNFVQTAPIQDHTTTERTPAMLKNNPQTEKYCQMLDLPSY